MSISVQTVFLAFGSTATFDTVTFTDYSELRPLVLDWYVPHLLFWGSSCCQLFCCYCSNILGTNIPYLFWVARKTYTLLSCDRGADQASRSSFGTQSPFLTVEEYFPVNFSMSHGTTHSLHPLGTCVTSMYP